MAEDKGGRPTDYSEDYVDQVYKLALLGAIDDEIADFFNVCVATLNNWKKKYPEFLASIKKGKEMADARVAQALFHRAIGYTHPEEKIFNNNGEILRADTTKHYPPDTAACLIWLKNRRREDWKQNPEPKTKGEENVPEDYTQPLRVDEDAPERPIV